MVIDDRRPFFIKNGVYWPGFTCGVELKDCIRTYVIDHITARQPQIKAEKNQARLKQLRGRAGRWA